mmetsp:Transcript_1461/g.3029  ORF Transcript_1461/g.3029 Transcript_1461/m.3029 type:complete len:211 (-) Transcript_1461:1069-1701(-)
MRSTKPVNWRSNQRKTLLFHSLFFQKTSWHPRWRPILRFGWEDNSVTELPTRHPTRLPAPSPFDDWATEFALESPTTPTNPSEVICAWSLPVAEMPRNAWASRRVPCLSVPEPCRKEVPLDLGLVNKSSSFASITCSWSRSTAAKNPSRLISSSPPTMSVTSDLETMSNSESQEPNPSCRLSEKSLSGSSGKKMPLAAPSLASVPRTRVY